LSREADMDDMVNKELAEHIQLLVSPYLAVNGIELVDIIYRREQGGMVLRLLADTPFGITVQECEKLNGHLSGLLDNENLIRERYIIEVSSPGLDRPIVSDRDFERSMGKALDITTYETIDMRKTHEGRLIGMDKDSIVIESKDVSTVIPKRAIARARLKIETRRDLP
jgi:ribosome maturation factor RimP